MMFSATSIQVRSKPGVPAVLASLGSLPLLGSVFTGFVVGSLLGFQLALVCIVSGMLAGAWLRGKGGALFRRAFEGPHAGAPGRARESAVAARLYTAWTVVNLAIQAVVLQALCGGTWLAAALLAAVALSRVPALRRHVPAAAGAIVLLLFYPVCLGLMASCAAASTWAQVLAAPASLSGAPAVVGAMAWVTLASLAGAAKTPQWRAVNELRDGWWRATGAAGLAVKLPACLLGILISASYYDANGFQANFGKALSWVIGSSAFCTRWMVVAVFAAGLCSMSMDIFTMLRSRKFEWFSQGVVAGAPWRP